MTRTLAAADHASSATGRKGRGMSGFIASSAPGDDERVLRTWLTERFDLHVPVVSAPMAHVSGGALAAAVSAAGGLGTIGFAAGPPEALRAECEIAARSGRPFGVGLLAWLLPRDES